MPLRDTVRDAQRRLAELDGAHRRAAAKLDRAAARRNEVIAEQDGIVAEARVEVERAVGAMAAEVGVALTATLLGLEASHVRRLAKRPGSGDAPARPKTGKGSASTRLPREQRATGSDAGWDDDSGGL